jgi:ribosome assembly protein SQT1
MVFTSPSWVPELPAPPDSIPISELIFNEKYGRRAFSNSRDPFTCGLSGKSYTLTQVQYRCNNLAKALSKELQWRVNDGGEYSKVAGIFCLNTVYSTAPLLPSR